MEEALPRLKECDLEKASRLHKAKTGVGCDGFHSTVPLDLANKPNAEGCRNTLARRCSFLVAMNVTLALMPTLIRW